MADFMQIIDVNKSGVERVLHPETNADFVIPGSAYQIPKIIEIMDWNDKSQEIVDARKGKVNLKTKIDEIDIALLPASLLNAIKGVDGSGSGLDADTVDGKTVDDSNDGGTSLWTASKIVSELNKKVNNIDVVIAATANKILRLDANGNLPTNITKNSATSTKLQNPLKINFIGDVSGSITFSGNEGIKTVDMQVSSNSHSHSELTGDLLLLSSTGESNIVDFNVNGVTRSYIDNSGNFSGSASKVMGFVVDDLQDSALWTGEKVKSTADTAAQIAKIEAILAANEQAVAIAQTEAQTIVESELQQYATQIDGGIALGPVSYRYGEMDVSDLNTISIQAPMGINNIISESYTITSSDNTITFVKDESSNNETIKINFNKTAPIGTKIRWNLTTI